MPAITPVATPRPHKTPCPNCGKTYRTLLKRHYGIRIVGDIKQSIPIGTQWRCLSCGKSYTTEDC